MSERVVLVDEQDREVGTAGKMAAHEAPGTLHRAVSVFLYDDAGRLLIQRRSRHKHHFQRLWANTACSHPAPGESELAAGERRLRQEMGIVAPLEKVGSFVYRATDPVSGLVEHEYDHVLTGRSDADPRMDLREADAFERVAPRRLLERLERDETGFVPWLRLAMQSLPLLVDPR